MTNSKFKGCGSRSPGRTFNIKLADHDVGTASRPHGHMFPEGRARASRGTASGASVEAGRNLQ